MQFDFTLNEPNSPALHLTRSFWTGRTTLFVNGTEQPALPAESFFKRANKAYLIPMPDGTQRRLTLTNKFYDPVPEVRVDGQVLPLAKSLQTWEYVVAALPLVLFGFGALGGGLGVGALLLNMNIMRSERPTGARVALALGVTVGAVVVVLALAGLAQEAMAE